MKKPIQIFLIALSLALSAGVKAQSVEKKFQQVLKAF